MHLRVAIREAVVDIHCMCGCGSYFETQEVVQLISDDEDLMHRFERFRKVKSDTQFRECPSCGAGCSTGSLQAPQIACPECRTMYCFIHGGQHPDQDCLAFSKIQLQKEKSSLSAIARISKSCPRCDCRTEKAGGCNHITCRQCNADWCWLCNKDISGPVGVTEHFTLDSSSTCGGLQFSEMGNIDLGGVAGRLYIFFTRVLPLSIFKWWLFGVGISVVGFAFMLPAGVLCVIAAWIRVLAFCKPTELPFSHIVSEYFDEMNNSLLMFCACMLVLFVAASPVIFVGLVIGLVVQVYWCLSIFRWFHWRTEDEISRLEADAMRRIGGYCAQDTDLTRVLSNYERREFSSFDKLEKLKDTVRLKLNRELARRRLALFPQNASLPERWIRTLKSQVVKLDQKDAEYIMSQSLVFRLRLWLLLAEIRMVKSGNSQDPVLCRRQLGIQNMIDAFSSLFSADMLAEDEEKTIEQALNGQMQELLASLAESTESALLEVDNLSWPSSSKLTFRLPTSSEPVAFAVPFIKTFARKLRDLDDNAEITTLAGGGVGGDTSNSTHPELEDEANALLGILRGWMAELRLGQLADDVTFCRELLLSECVTADELHARILEQHDNDLGSMMADRSPTDFLKVVGKLRVQEGEGVDSEAVTIAVIADDADVSDEQSLSPSVEQLLPPRNNPRLVLRLPISAQDVIGWADDDEIRQPFEPSLCSDIQSYLFKVLLLNFSYSVLPTLLALDGFSQA